MKTINDVFIDAVKVALESGLHGTQVDVARRLGLSRGAFNNKMAGRRGTTEEFRRAVCEALSINYDDIVREARPPLSREGAVAIGNFLRDGEAAILERRNAKTSPHTTPAHPSGPDPPSSPPTTPTKQEDDDQLPTPSQAIEMTKAVLASRTIYRGALLQNIKAFFRAVEGEEEMSVLKDRVVNIESMLETLTRELREFRMEQQATDETPAKKREAQGN